MCSLCSAPTRPFVSPGRLLAGPGASARCADELRALGVAPGAVLVVADATVLDLGLHLPLLSSLTEAGFSTLVGAGVAGEPTPATVTALLWLKGTRKKDQSVFEYKLWFSDTYVRTKDGWRYAFGQASLRLP